MKALLLTMVLLAGGAAVAPWPIVPAYGKAHAATHQLRIGPYGCSATAVGPYRLLTAAHCLPDGKAAKLLVDGEMCEVWRTELDGFDHALLTLGQHCKQDSFARIGKRVATCEEVFMFGNPGILSDQLRVGRAAGFGVLPREVWSDGKVYSTLFQSFDINAGPGDSGAGLFNRRGEVVGVISITTFMWNSPANLVGAYPLHFTPKQWK